MSDLSYVADPGGSRVRRFAVAISQGIADAFKFVATGADGKIDSSFLPASAGGNPDWNASAGSASAILNKPALGTAAAKNVGTGADDLIQGSNPALTNARQPTAHNHTQAESHGSPDTDVSAAALHHTLGTGPFQAAVGNHGHTELHSHANKTVLDKFSEVGGVLKYNEGDLPTSTGGGDMYKSANLAGLADPVIARSNLGLGSAATRNTPVSGDAGPTESVIGSDSRLSGPRPPTAHNHPQAESHALTDVNASPDALHHTLGSGANQAAPGSHVGAGSDAHALAVSNGAAGFISGAEKKRIEDIELIAEEAAPVQLVAGLAGNVTALQLIAALGISSKQATLASGTNIKTINGQSILGSGDLTVSASGSSPVRLTAATTLVSGGVYEYTTGYAHTFPLAPNNGDMITLINMGTDVTASVAGNGKKIMNSVSAMQLNLPNTIFKFLYVNANAEGDWRIS